MNAAITTRIDDSITRLDEARQNVTRRAVTLYGRTREEALTTLLRSGAAALEGLAGVGRKLPATRKAAKTLAARASALDDARKSLGQPAIANYDDLNVRQVQDALDKLSAWEVAKVRAYEASHKERKTVLAACDRILEG